MLKSQSALLLLSKLLLASSWLAFATPAKAACTNEEKITMVQLGISAAAIKSHCAQQSTTDKNSVTQSTNEKTGHVTINVNQTQNNNQAQNDSQGNTSVATHTPEKFFIEFGVGAINHLPTVGAPTAYEELSSGDITINAFSLSYFFDHMRTGSLGIGINGLDFIHGGYANNDQKKWLALTHDVLLYWVLFNTDNYAFVPYVGAGVGRFTIVEDQQSRHSTTGVANSNTGNSNALLATLSAARQHQKGKRYGHDYGYGYGYGKRRKKAAYPIAPERPIVPEQPVAPEEPVGSNNIATPANQIAMPANQANECVTQTSGDIRKSMVGIKVVSNRAHTGGSGMFFDVRYDSYGSATVDQQQEDCNNSLQTTQINAFRGVYVGVGYIW